MYNIFVVKIVFFFLVIRILFFFKICFSFLVCRLVVLIIYFLVFICIINVFKFENWLLLVNFVINIFFIIIFVNLIFIIFLLFFVLIFKVNMLIDWDMLELLNKIFLNWVRLFGDVLKVSIYLLFLDLVLFLNILILYWCINNNFLMRDLKLSLFMVMDFSFFFFVLRYFIIVIVLKIFLVIKIVFCLWIV